MKLIRFVFALLLAFLLVACSHARYSTKKKSYLTQSGTLHPIVVPANAVGPVLKPYYPIPKRSVHANAAKPSMKPPGLE